MRTHRMGNEPLEARSPLHLRLILSAFGAVVLMIAAVYAFSLTDADRGVSFLGGTAVVFAIIAMVDVYVVAAELRRQNK